MVWPLSLLKYFWKIYEIIKRKRVKVRFTFDTSDVIMSFNASSIKTSILEWYCCCRDEGRGDKKSHYSFVIFRKLTRHRRNTDYPSALIYNSIVCAAKEIKTYNKSSHMHPFPGQPRKPSHPCNAAVLSS